MTCKSRMTIPSNDVGSGGGSSGSVAIGNVGEPVGCGGGGRGDGLCHVGLAAEEVHLELRQALLAERRERRKRGF